MVRNSIKSNRDEAYDLVVARVSSYLLHRLCASVAFLFYMQHGKARFSLQIKSQLYSP